MVSGKDSSFVNCFLLCLLFQNSILIVAGDCLNPTFKKDEKVLVEYFINNEVSTRIISADLCPIIHASNGKLSIIYRMCSGPIDKATCTQNILCVRNRRLACYYKYFKDEYNKCPKYLPSVTTTIADCVCAGIADDILTSNEALRVTYGVKTFPALVLNGKYDPCFTDLSSNGMKNYFCQAYNKQLPFC